MPINHAVLPIGGIAHITGETVSSGAYSFATSTYWNPEGPNLGINPFATPANWPPYLWYFATNPFQGCTGIPQCRSTKKYPSAYCHGWEADFVGGDVFIDSSFGWDNQDIIGTLPQSVQIYYQYQLNGTQYQEYNAAIVLDLPANIIGDGGAYSAPILPTHKRVGNVHTFGWTENPANNNVYYVQQWQPQMPFSKAFWTGWTQVATGNGSGTYTVTIPSGAPVPLLRVLMYVTSDTVYESNSFYYSVPLYFPSTFNDNSQMRYNFNHWH